MSKKLEHLKLDPIVCPHCCSDDTDEIDQGVGREVYDDSLPDEVRRCHECGQEYKVSYVKVLQSISWTDDDNQEHVIHDSDYLVKEAAQEVVQAADGITMQEKIEGALHIAPLTCPQCGEMECIEEADSRHFGDQERRSFYCRKCDSHWYQWEWVENSPYKIEYEGRDYALPKITPCLQDAAETARELLFGPIAQRMLEYASIEEQTELFAVRGMLKNALP